MTPITFFVRGEPKAQPRPKAFAKRFGQQWTARVYTPGTAEEWKSQIALAANEHAPLIPYSGPLYLDLTFWFPRPKSHYRGGDPNRGLKPNAPTYHTGKPDRDNLEKAVMDAMTVLGFWQDDGQVCDGPIRKFYHAYGQPPGCRIALAPAEEAQPDVRDSQIVMPLKVAMEKSPHAQRH